MSELEHWFRYEFLPRHPDGAMWRDKPIAEAALHFLKESKERQEARDWNDY